MEETISNEQKKKKGPLSVSVKWGVIGGLISTIYNLVVYLVQDTQTCDEGYTHLAVFFVVLIAMIIFASIEHRNKELDGSLSYGRGLGVGVLTSLTLGIIVAIWATIYVAYFVDMAHLETCTLERIIKQNDAGRFGRKLTESQLQAQVQMQIKMQTPPWLPIVTILNTTFIGTLISLITAIITKRKK